MRATMKPMPGFQAQTKIGDKKRGVSLVEALVTIAILAGMFTVVVPVMVALSRGERQIRSVHRLNSTAQISMERMSRVVREASSIDVTQSVFDMHPGALTLVASDGALSTTTRFYINNSALMVDENAVTEGSLSGDVVVDSLVFRRIATAISKGIRIELQLSNSSGNVVERATFYTTTFARGSY